MKSKFYLVSEEELVELLTDYYTMRMLSIDGVDSWTWYGSSEQEVIQRRFPSITTEELRDTTLRDCAIADLNNYKTVEI